MNLYLISQMKNDDYDTYDSAVVAAKSAEAAAKIHPNPRGLQWSGSTWVDDPEDVIVEYLGKAKRGTKPGVICASFNAG